MSIIETFNFYPFRFREDSLLGILFSYDEDIISLIKDFLNQYKKQCRNTGGAGGYIKELKIWYIEKFLESIFYNLLDFEGYRIHQIKCPWPELSFPLPDKTNLNNLPIHTNLFLLPNAPLEIAEAAYKVLAKKHHPDLGGDTGTMQILNKTIAEIRRKKNERRERKG